MKKIKTTMAALAATLLLTGCGSTGSSLLGSMATGSAASTSASTSAATGEEGGLASLLGNVLGAVLGASNELSEADLVGTWSYQGADCVFETENLLMQAGGEVAANKIETKLNETMAKIGIKTGTCSFTFNDDNTYSASIMGYNVSGQYTLDTENKKLTMTYLAGIATMTPNVVKSGSKISLLYDADKLLTLLQTMASMSNNTTMKTLASLASSYDGMMVGIEMQK